MRSLYHSLICLLLLTASNAFAQFEEDTTETNQEGFIVYGSHLAFGFGFFQAEGYTTTPGLAYEAGVSMKYQKAQTAYELALFASSRCASISEARIEAMRLT